MQIHCKHTEVHVFSRSLVKIIEEDYFKSIAQ